MERRRAAIIINVNTDISLCLQNAIFIRPSHRSIGIGGISIGDAFRESALVSAVLFRPHRSTT